MKLGEMFCVLRKSDKEYPCVVSLSIRYGSHYWLLDVQMNCSQTEHGWFEFKAFVTNHGDNGGWERDVTQVLTCNGDVGGSKPYSGTNHFARCGYVNVFDFNGSGCRVEEF